MENFRKHRPRSYSRQASDGFSRSPNTIGRNGPASGVSRRSYHGSPAKPLNRPAVSTDGIRRPGVPRIQPHSQVGRISPMSQPQPLRTVRRNANYVQPSGLPKPVHPPQKLNFEAPKRRKSLNPFDYFSWGKKQTIGALASVVIVAGGLFGGRIWLILNGIFEGGGEAVVLQEDVDPYALKGEGDGRVNILLVGRDEEGTGLTDTVLLASINPIQKEAAILSVPRDLYVQNSDGYYSKVNAIFPNTARQYIDTAGETGPAVNKKADKAGIKALSDVVQSKIGLPIHYYAMIDLKGFKKAINTVGGVDISVPKELAVYDQMRFNGRDYILNVKAGERHFDGLRAMAFARTRYTSARGDFDRSERQRLILTALKSEILSAGTYGDPRKVSGLMADFGDHIRTNLGIEEAMRLYEIAEGIENSNVTSIGLADEPHQLVATSMVDGQSVVIPTAGIDDYREIQFYIRNRLRDGFLAKEDAKVKILNGTTIPGLAARTSENLQSFGYNVVGVGDAPTRGYHTTMIVDLTDGVKKYTKRYLENRFYVGVRANLPDPQIKAGDADFIIILGQNEQVRLSTSAPN